MYIEPSEAHELYKQVIQLDRDIIELQQRLEMFWELRKKQAHKR